MKISHCISARLIVLCLGLVTTLRVSATDFYISPTGLDSNNGTSAATPVESLLQLRTLIRAATTNGTTQSDQIVAHFAGGEYLQTIPAFLQEADSGSNGFQITYHSDGGPGQAAIVGAASLAGTWTQVPGSPVWTTTLAAGLTLPAIYESGKPGWPARAPNRSSNFRFPQSHAAYASSTGGAVVDSTHDSIGFTASQFGSVPAVSSWTLTAAKVQWWKAATDSDGHLVDWGIDQGDLISVLSGSQFTIQHFGSDTPGVSERFFVENVPELLDAPGEFYYNSGTGLLEYWPVAANPNLVDIRAPSTNYLVEATGTASAHTHIHDRVFDGLKFAYTALDPSGTYRGAVLVQTADHISFTNCEFTAVGQAALFISDENSYDTVSNCWIHDCGMGGIWINNSALRGTTSPYPSTHHTISNCLIHDIGDIEPDAVWTVGVFLNCVDNTTVTNCEIFNSARYATSLRGHYTSQNNPPVPGPKYMSFNNTFSYLKVHDCMMDSGDGGSVHAAGVNTSSDSNFNTWNQLLIAGSYADPSMQDFDPDGMFFDYQLETVLQPLSNIKITFSQDLASGGAGFRTNKNGGKWTGLPEGTEAGETMTNVSWGVDSSGASFNDSLMDYANIGLTAAFPRAAFSLLPNYPEGYTDGTVVSDDQTSDFALVGTWSESSAPGLKYGDGQYHGASSITDYAEWRPTLPYTGNYTVSVWQIPGISGASGAAPYTITDATGTAIGYVNQATGTTTGWTALGSYPFLAGRGTSDGYVRLNPTTTGAVRADAVEFTYLGSTNVAMGGETGWWKFDGDASDASGNGLTGVPMVVPPDTITYSTSVKAVGTGSVMLDGTDYEYVADHSWLDIGTGSFAISMWFDYTSSGTGTQWMLFKGAGYAAQAGYQLSASNTTVSFAVGNGTNRTVVSAAHAGPNQWNHVVANIDRTSGTVTLVVNGVAGSPTALPAGGANLTSTLNLNFGANSGTASWIGGLDEIRIFQRALTPAEIRSLYRP